MGRRGPELITKSPWPEEEEVAMRKTSAGFAISR